MLDFCLITKEKITYDILAKDILESIPKCILNSYGISYGKGIKFVCMDFNNQLVFNEEGDCNFDEQFIIDMKIENYYFNILEYHNEKSALRLLQIIKLHYPDLIILGNDDEIINIDEI